MNDEVASPMERSASRSSSILLGEDLRQSGDPAAQRRPSLILTSAPSDEPQGLALGVDIDQLPPSPRLRRSYPSNSSPSTPQTPYFSTSPVGSPVLGSFPSSIPSSFPSPFLSAGSPTLAPSSPVEKAPSSPRLSSFTDPLGRLATGIVRRASNSSLNAELPTSRSRSPSPNRAPPSPTLSSPSLSPNIGSGGATIRRSSFAAQAREKEKEKEREAKEMEQKKREEKFRHTRGKSWSAKTAGQTKGGFGLGWLANRKRTLAGLVVIVGLFLIYSRVSGGGNDSAAQVRQPVGSVGSRMRRPARGGGGRSFIHPHVVERPKPSSKSWLTAPWRWIRSIAVSQPIERSRFTQSLRQRKTAGVTTDKNDKTKDAKRRSVFVSAPTVRFVDHEALPPPVEHSAAPERDTLVLYRILGNDLPPRHSPGQTLRNLRFLLQHESDFSVLPPLGPHGVHHSHLYGSGSKAKQAHTQMGGLRVDKYFVLNRIAEPEMVNAIIGLLHLYSVPDSRILIIPFEWDEYQLREFRWDGGVDRAFGWGIGAAPVYKPVFGDDKWRAVDPEEALENSIERMADLLEEADSEEAKALQAKHRKSHTLARLRALDFTYHEKNLYAMNNVSLSVLFLSF